MDALQLHRLVIVPTLRLIAAGGASAEVLILGTGLHESGGLQYIRQLPDGPARGLYGMEPDTHDDIWDNFLPGRPRTRRGIINLMFAGMSPRDQLYGNLPYATAMARAHYLRVTEPLPPADDAAAMARYHKQHFNTPAGKADPEKTVAWFRQAIEIHRNAETR